MVCPCISCIDCCVGRANGARAGPDLVGGSSGGGGHDSLQLALVVFSFHQLAQILHLHLWWSDSLQLVLVVFSFQPLVQTFHLYSCNMLCVVGVVVLGGSGNGEYI